MDGQGVGQILFFLGALIVLAYPLGLWMARVYGNSLSSRPAAGARERLLPARRHPAACRAGLEELRADGARLQRCVHRCCCTRLQRLQARLFLNPDRMKAVPPHLALNTAVSFVTNTSWQFYGGESTMSYLTQTAGIAVQMFVSAAVGMAVLVAVIRGLARRSATELGNFWVDFYRSLAYILLPLTLRAGRRSRLAGRAADVRRTRHRDDARRRHADDRARAGRIARGDQEPLDGRRRLLQLQLGGAVREPERPDELPGDALTAPDPGRAGLHVRANDPQPQARPRRLRRDARPARRGHRRHHSLRSSTARPCSAPPE